MTTNPNTVITFHRKHVQVFVSFVLIRKFVSLIIKNDLWEAGKEIHRDVLPPVQCRTGKHIIVPRRDLL